MLVVDSSVWIDFFSEVEQPAVEQLRKVLEHGEVRVVVPDLVLFEVLRGFRHERDHRRARALMETMSVEDTAGPRLAVAAADHYRSLRLAGITVRRAIDVLIATFCIDRGYALLHRDRDYDAFERLRGMQVWEG